MKGSPLPLLSLLHSTSLTSVTPSGVLDHVPLPWEAAGLFAIPGGLLLQGKEEGRASLLALTKPQGDLVVHPPLPPPPRIRPLTCLPLPQPPTQEVSLGGREEDWGRVIWSSAETPLVVTYHSASQRHALWRLEGDRCLKRCWQQGGRAAQAEEVVVWEDSGREAMVGLLDSHSHSLLCVIPSQPPWHLPALAAAVITPPATRHTPPPLHRRPLPTAHSSGCSPAEVPGAKRPLRGTCWCWGRPCASLSMRGGAQSGAAVPHWAVWG